MARKKRTKPRKKNIFPVPVFLIGMMTMCIVFVLMLLIGKFVIDKRQQNGTDFVAPYYEQNDFKLPKDLQSVISTNSATLFSHYPSIKAKIPILMYHYVEYVKDTNDTIRAELDVAPNIFESHLKVLHDNNYKTYFVKDLPEILKGEMAYSDKSIVLTFDDGYEDFYTEVFPRLKKYQIKATLYVIYDYIGRRGFLNEKEINELVRSGLVEIGSHTLDHAYLKKLPLSLAQVQIFSSKKKLEEKFGIEIKTFAYPNGAFNQDIADLVRQAGYSAAVSVIPGTYHTTDSLFYLTRIRPGVFTNNTMIAVLNDYKN